MSNAAWSGEPPTSAAPSDRPSPRRWRDRIRVLGAVVLAVTSIVLRFLQVTSSDGGAGPSADVDRGPKGAFARTLPAGTCTIEPYPSGFVRPTPCSERHGSEIIAQLTYPSPPGGAYPPIQEAFARALDLCETAFEAYVGGTADQTPARFFVVLPTLSEWRGGERLVVCFANGRNGVELTTSVRAGA